MGRAGARRPHPVRVPRAGRGTGRSQLAHDSREAPPVPPGLRPLRPGAGRALRRARRRAALARRRHRAQPAEDRSRDRERACRPRAATGRWKPGSTPVVLRRRHPDAEPVAHPTRGSGDDARGDGDVARPDPARVPVRRTDHLLRADAGHRHGERSRHRLLPSRAARTGRPTAMSTRPLWYFAYGSNLCRAIFVDRRGLQPLEIRRARLEGHRLTFDLPVGPGERGVANLVADPAAATWGVCYLLDAAACDHLDRTEGVHRGYYRRLEVSVVTDDGGSLQAFAYQGIASVAGRKPSQRYLGLLLDGAREHGLPEEWIRYLEGLELAVDERLGSA